MKYINFKIINLLIILLLFFPFKGTSQNANDVMETIVTSGSNASGTSGTVTYSIGQVFYTYIGESIYTVAQGIQHQETEKNLETPEIEAPATELFVFPNPTTDYVTLRVKVAELQNGERYYKLYDIQGKLLKQSSFDETETQISLSNLSTSIYILTVYIDNQVLKTFKIFKK